jgi:hypothetical protein
MQENPFAANDVDVGCSTKRLSTANGLAPVSLVTEGWLLGSREDGKSTILGVQRRIGDGMNQMDSSSEYMGITSQPGSETPIDPESPINPSQGDVGLDFDFFTVFSLSDLTLLVKKTIMLLDTLVFDVAQVEHKIIEQQIAECDPENPENSPLILLTLPMGETIETCEENNLNSGYFVTSQDQGYGSNPFGKAFEINMIIQGYLERDSGGLFNSGQHNLASIELCIAKNIDAGVAEGYLGGSLLRASFAKKCLAYQALLDKDSDYFDKINTGDLISCQDQGYQGELFQSCNENKGNADCATNEECIEGRCIGSSNSESCTDEEYYDGENCVRLGVNCRILKEYTNEFYTDGEGCCGLGGD